MQDHDQEEYGAVRSVVVTSNSKSSRSYAVTAAIFVMMAAALALLVSNSQSSPVEEMIISPDDQLERLVHSFMQHGDTMSLAEMEKKLADWRHSSDTILDADGAKRMQANEMKLILCSFQSNKTTVAVFGGYNPHPIPC